jgi:hypothetical protein
MKMSEDEARRVFEKLDREELKERLAGSDRDICFFQQLRGIRVSARQTSLHLNLLTYIGLTGLALLGLILWRVW